MDMRVEYIRALIIEADLVYARQQLENAQGGILDALRALRQLFVFMDNLRVLLTRTARIVKENTVVVQLRREMSSDLDHLRYLRNRIGGHLDTNTLESIVHHEPVMFQDSLTRDVQLLLSSVRLVDSAINSRTDELGIPTLFNDFFDSEFPLDQARLWNWVGSFVNNALLVCKHILSELDSHIGRLSSEEVMGLNAKIYLGLE